MFNFKKANWEDLNADFSAIPWSAFLCHDDINESVSMFYDIVLSAISDHVPRIKVRRRVPPWYDAELIAALKLKELRHRMKKRIPLPEHIQLFKQARDTLKKMAKTKYEEYLASVAEGVETEPRRFFSFASTSLSSISLSKNAL